MATRLVGPMSWSMSRDEEGYREYKLPWKIKAGSLDGPFRVLNTPGLPLPGAVWALGNDLDHFVWCRPSVSVQPFDQKNDEPTKYWVVENTFSNKPYNYCTDELANPLNNPLLIPFKKSGSYVKYTEEAVVDRFGQAILTSSHEAIRGPHNEWDANRPQVMIEQNVPSLQLALVDSMIDCLNDRPLWGLSRRCVKLSDFTWEEKYYGGCFRYFNRRFTFDVRNVAQGKGGRNSQQQFGGFDRELLDEGTKALSGHWDNSTDQWVLDNIAGLTPNRANPRHFVRFKDRQGENCRVILDGKGLPYNPDAPVQTNCFQCPNGSPEQWLVRGFLGTFPKFENVILNHTSFCTWYGEVVSGDPNQGSLTLEYDSGADEWSLEGTLPPTVGAQTTLGPFTRDDEFFDCKGNNLLRRVIVSSSAGTALGPDAVTIIPYGGNSPGSIFVQKYGEANFYLLGVPAFLG